VHEMNCPSKKRRAGSDSSGNTVTLRCLAFQLVGCYRVTYEETSRSAFADESGLQNEPLPPEIVRDALGGNWGYPRVNGIGNLGKDG
jgi:hypothetical protein